MTGDERVLIGIAVGAAFAAGLMAVAQHANCTTAGYDLAVAQRENLELRRTAAELDRRVSSLSTPQAAVARAAAMKLTNLKYPKTWNIVRGATVRAVAASPVAAAPLPAAAKGTLR